MRADLLLSALLLLQAHGKPTGRARASRLQVSRRTVHPDMEALSAAGIPVFALRGALRVHFEDEKQARFVVLEFGPNVEATEPDALREQVTTDLTTMFERARRQARNA